MTDRESSGDAGIRRANQIGATALFVFIAGWAWLAAGFTARQSSWWTALWYPIALEGLAAALALAALRSALAILVVVLAGLTTALLLLLLLAVG